MRRHIARDYNHARANGRPKRRRANGSFAPGRKSPTAPTTAFANCASSALVNSRRGWNCKGSANALQRLFIPLRERYRTRTVLKMVKCLTHYIKLFGAIRNNGAHGLSVSRTPLQKGAPRRARITFNAGRNPLKASQTPIATLSRKLPKMGGLKRSVFPLKSCDTEGADSLNFPRGFAPDARLRPFQFRKCAQKKARTRGSRRYLAPQSAGAAILSPARFRRTRGR